MSTDPLRSFSYRLVIANVILAGFSDVSGLKDQEETDGLRKLPGRAKYSNVTLKRGLTNSKELWDWHREATTGMTPRKSASIVLVDERGRQVKCWCLRNAWPVKLIRPALKATANDVAIETLELTCEGIEVC
jgi:phage tail-like protein